MKKITVLISSAVIAALSSLSASAQPMDFGPGMFFDEGKPEMFSEQRSSSDETENITNAKEYAAEQTDRLAGVIELTEEQYKKIFKIYKTEAQTIINEKNMGSNSMMGPGMMMGSAASSSSSDSVKQKRIDKRNSKISEILTSAQFNIYLRMQQI